MWAEKALAPAPLVGIVQAVGLARTFCAIVLLALWPAVTSHALLQQAGLIHEFHDDHHGGEGSHEHNSENHDFADGDYTSATGAKALQKPDTVVCTELWQAVSECSIRLRYDAPGPAPPGTAPPLLQKSWSFLLRTALPVRAPSLFPDLLSC